MSRLPSVLHQSDLPLAELCAARLDGELFPLAAGFVPPDLPPGAVERAAALRPLAPAGVIVELLSAAWVHGALDLPPERHTFCVEAGRRIRVPFDPAIAVREVRLEPDDLVEIGERRVTTPLRTIVDLARSRAPWTPELRTVIAALAEHGGVDLAACRRRVDAGRNLPHKRLALERIAAALDGR